MTIAAPLPDVIFVIYVLVMDDEDSYYVISYYLRICGKDCIYILM
ncbi:hypothetical protein [Psychrobacillus vulpis]|nr:hypothetical protein [Psychrobacillus vulpis]